MALQLNHPIAMMSTAQYNALSPAEKLRFSAQMPIEFLFHNAPRTPAAMQSLAHVHNTTPQVLHTMMRRRAHTARRPNIPKRPLNSWMAFRSFYSGIFATLQQKDASSYLTALWQKDPFKAKWTIIARAYSSVRDAVGKQNAPLDTFLDLVTPQVGVLGIPVYMSSMNWVSEVIDGATIIRQTSSPDLSSFPLDIMYTGMTEKDIVHFCATRGYITHATAARIAGQTTQQSLLASAPILPKEIIPAIDGALPNSAQEPKHRLDTSLTERSTSYQWTGSMADLYNPGEGSLDFENIAHLSRWDTINIQDAATVDALVEDHVQGGFVAPFVA